MSALRPPLRFEALSVHRMPGIERPGYALPPLSPHINVIHGPNASGKTTTARALRALLWPEHPHTPPDAALTSTFTLNDQSWHIELEAGRCAFHCNGRPAEPPLRPSNQSADRYNLALHELIHSDSSDLARTIVRESTGGYDLAAAAAQLNFTAQPSQPRKLKQQLDDAHRRLQQARQRERQLQQELATLEQLRQQRDDAHAAKARAELLQAAIDWHHRKREHGEAQAKLASLPDVLQHITGNEIDQLSELDQQIAQQTDQLREHERTIARTERTLAEADLPHEPPAELVPSLNEQLRQLQELHRQQHDAQASIDAAQTQCEAERQRLGQHVDAEKLSRLNIDQLGDLAAFAQQAEQLNAQQYAHDQMQQWLARPQHDAPDPQPIHEAVRILERWLAAGDTARPDRRAQIAATVGAIALLVASVALGLTLHAGLLAAGLISVAVLIVTWWPRGEHDAHRQVHQHSFASLDIDPPQTWDLPHVEQRLERLRQDLAVFEIEHERYRRWQQIDQQRQTLDEQTRQLEQQRQQLIDTLGVAPEITEPQLYMLAERISRFQDADNRLTSERARLETLQQQSAATLEQLNQQLTRFNQPTAADTAQAHGSVQSLTQRIDQHRQAQRDRENARDARRHCRATLAQLKRRRRSLFQRFGLRPGQQAQLHQLCQQLGQYTRAREALRQAQWELDRAGQSLDQLTNDPAALRDTAMETLTAEHEQALERAEQWQSLYDQVRELEQRERDARMRHDVEAALAQRQRCEQALRDAFDADAATVAGSVLLDHLQQRITQQHRPRVFHRAAELLARFTAGRCQLDFQETDPPAFRAIDTTTGRSQSLDELSTGTRIQLLLAVRVAFIETQETAAALPLWLDEALATSDDHRARAIIQAVIELARDGRQVFYFTAQHDELSKWQQMLDDAGDVPYRLIDLAAARDQHTAAALPLPAIASEPEPAPAPRSDDHADYATLLEVPALDPLRDPGHAHIWYLIDQPALIHELLQQRVRTWGQLRTMLDQLGADLLGPEHAAVLQRAHARGQALERIVQLYRIGRGKPVTAQALRDSGAVSEPFMDQLIALARELDHDAQQIIDALEAGKVPRWRKAKTDELRRYFEQQGYIDTAPPLDREQIRWRALAAIDLPAEDQQSLIAHIDWLLDMLEARSQPSTTTHAG